MNDCLQGECPECKGKDLNYTNHDFQDEQMSYDFECQTCGFLGREWYKLVFIETVERD